MLGLVQPACPANRRQAQAGVTLGSALHTALKGRAKRRRMGLNDQTFGVQILYFPLPHQQLQTS